MLGDFLGIRCEIAVKPDAVGRWKQDTGRHDFEFLTISAGTQVHERRARPRRRKKGKDRLPKIVPKRAGLAACPCGELENKSPS